MEHREIKTPAQIAELKKRSPGGYRNLRETVINELPDALFMTPTAVEGDGGSVGEQVKLAKGHYVMLRDQVKDLAEEELLRTPSVTDGTGGARSAKQAKERRQMVKVADQIAELAAVNGLQVTESIANSLLPTVIASEGTKASAAQSSEERLKTGQVFLTNIIYDVAVENGLPVPPRLLPTPISSDSKATGPADANRVTVQLRAINHLLPTVTTQESKSGPSQLNRNTIPLNALIPTLLGTPRASAAKGSTAKQVEAGATKSRIEDQVLVTNWGKFTAAIERWEALTRPAPAPTKPDGKNGNHRLSAEFTEWMMGLPAGWITAEDIGLKRNDALKACGNGVVPQQAEMALRILLQGLPFESTIRGGLASVLPTPTVMDQRDGKHFRAVAIKNLENGVNRGLNLNNVVEAIGVDWQDGDTFTMTEDGLKKNDN